MLRARRGRFWIACAMRSTSPWKRSTPMKKLAKQILFYSALLGVWALLAKLRIWPPYLFPPPWGVGHALWDGFADHSFWIGIAVTMKRMLIGYSLSVDRGDDSGVAGSGGLDEGVEVVSEGAADEFYQPGRGSPRLRVSSESVVDCGGVGWDLWEQPGVADASGVSAGAADRLHFCRVCRGTRVCRSSGGSAVILHSADAVDPECTNGARPRWSISGDGCGGCA